MSILRRVMGSLMLGVLVWGTPTNGLGMQHNASAQPAKGDEPGDHRSWLTMDGLSTEGVRQLGGKFDAVSVTLKGGSGVRITAVYTGTSRLRVDDSEEHPSGSAIVLPLLGNELTFEGKSGDSRVAWTGVGLMPNTGAIEASVAKSSASTEGCEIYVTSKPAGAAVTFNGKRYYRSTNTSSVRDPGTWVVTVSLGQRAWKGSRKLGPRDTWTIKVNFEAMK
jgi:hypothetical protein